MLYRSRCAFGCTAMHVRHKREEEPIPEIHPRRAVLLTKQRNREEHASEEISSGFVGTHFGGPTCIRKSVRCRASEAYAFRKHSQAPFQDQFADKTRRKAV